MALRFLVLLLALPASREDDAGKPWAVLVEPCGDREALPSVRSAMELTVERLGFRFRYVASTPNSEAFAEALSSNAELVVLSSLGDRDHVVTSCFTHPGDRDRELQRLEIQAHPVLGDTSPWSTFDRGETLYTVAVSVIGLERLLIRTPGQVLLVGPASTPRLFLVDRFTSVGTFDRPDAPANIHRLVQAYAARVAPQPPIPVVQGETVLVPTISLIPAAADVVLPIESATTMVSNGGHTPLENMEVDFVLLPTGVSAHLRGVIPKVLRPGQRIELDIQINANPAVLAKWAMGSGGALAYSVSGRLLDGRTVERFGEVRLWASKGPLLTAASSVAFEPGKSLEVETRPARDERVHLAVVMMPRGVSWRPNGAGDGHLSFADDATPGMDPAPVTFVAWGGPEARLARPTVHMLQVVGGAHAPLPMLLLGLHGAGLLILGGLLLGARRQVVRG